MKKKIKVKFLDVVGDPENNFIVDILKERYDVEISENPEYLFFESKSKGFLDYNCIRIFYTPENLVPDFNICDYAMGFNYIDFQHSLIQKRSMYIIVHFGNFLPCFLRLILRHVINHKICIFRLHYFIKFVMSIKSCQVIQLTFF